MTPLPDFLFSLPASLVASSRLTALVGVLLGLSLVALSPASRAADTPTSVPVATPTATPDTEYRTVDLKVLVPASRTEVRGQKIIFAPSPVRFRAQLSAMPAPQKAEYLNAALSMMKVARPPVVSQRIGLDYGGDKALAAYVEDGAAEKLKTTAHLGQAFTFYAFHVYNANRGPALVVTAFEP